MFVPHYSWEPLTDLRAPNSTSIEEKEVPLPTGVMVPKYMTTASCLFLKYLNSSWHSQVGGLCFPSFLCSKYGMFYSLKFLLGILHVLFKKKIY